MPQEAVTIPTFNPETEKRRKLAKEISDSLGIDHSFILFGSTERGTARPDSDLDAMVILKHVGQIAEHKSPLTQNIPTDDLLSLPPDINCVMVDQIVGGVPVHLEFYTEYWLKKLITSKTKMPHRTAFWDPDAKRERKPTGKMTTLDGSVVTFDRKNERMGSFYVSTDYEPEEHPDKFSLRIEQRKIANCNLIRDDCDTEASLSISQGMIFLDAKEVLGREPEIPDIAHAFTREEEGVAQPLTFQSDVAVIALDTLRKNAEAFVSPEKPRRLPHSLRVSITDACNLRCVYCMGEGNSPLTAREGRHMSLEDFRQLAKTWKEMGGKKIKYTGGEPFLNRNLFQFFGAASELGLKQSITTNGYYLTDKNIQILKEFKVDLIVSLDTMAPGAKSKMSPVGAPAELIAKKIEKARAEGLDVEVNTVLTKYSVESIVDTMLPWAIAHNIPLRILEEGEVIEGKKSGYFLDIKEFAKQMAEKFGLTIETRGFYNDLVAKDQEGKVVAYFLSSFCGNRDAESCFRNSLRVDSACQAVPCMRSGVRIPLKGQGKEPIPKHRLTAALNFQQTCPR